MNNHPHCSCAFATLRDTLRDTLLPKLWSGEIIAIAADKI